MVKYTSRDRASILEDLKSAIPTMTEQWRPEGDADPGVVLLKAKSSVGAMHSMNLDMQAGECYADTVRQRKNAVKVFNAIGYKLGWYTTAKTEVTFTNNTGEDISYNFTYNHPETGTGTFTQVRATTDITNQPRIITYNVLPGAVGFNAQESKRMLPSEYAQQFVFNTLNDSDDRGVLKPGESITRVAVEGELRSFSVSKEAIENNNMFIELASQHVDPTVMWITDYRNYDNFSDASDSESDTNWVQVSNPSEFAMVPEPRWALVYDNYSNARIQITGYAEKGMEFEYLTVYWFETLGAKGNVSVNAFTEIIPNIETAGTMTELTVTNLSTINETPHTYTYTGKSPETASQAYINSRKYINTWNSLITLYDFNRFLVAESGVSTGVVIDCQEALRLNKAIFDNPSISDVYKSRKYIRESVDFPREDTLPAINFEEKLEEKYVKNLIGAMNFKRYLAQCFCIQWNFAADYSDSKSSTGMFPISSAIPFYRYRPTADFLESINSDYLPLKAMTVALNFGYIRVFEWFVTGVIYTHKPVDRSTGNEVIQAAKSALSLRYYPGNAKIGELPSMQDIFKEVLAAHPNIKYFDPGSGTVKRDAINWDSVNGIKYDISYFNPISFARYLENSHQGSGQNGEKDIIIAPECYVSGSF